MGVFAAGLLFRPVGALIFGRLGDRFGRKGTFLATITPMGVETTKYELALKQAGGKQELHGWNG